MASSNLQVRGVMASNPYDLQSRVHTAYGLCIKIDSTKDAAPHFNDYPILSEYSCQLSEILCVVT